MGLVYSRIVFVPPPASYASNSDGEIQLTFIAEDGTLLEGPVRLKELRQSVVVSDDEEEPKVEPTEDKKLPKMRIPAYHYIYRDPITDKEAEWTIIYSHGNAEDIGQTEVWLRFLSDTLKISIITYDYTGYGLNRGSPSENKCYKCIKAVFLYLKNTCRIPTQHIILYGRSLGSGPTTHEAQYLSKKGTKFGGMILQSPLASAVAVVSTRLSRLPWIDMFKNSKKIGDVNGPICIIHGDRDEVVPYEHGEILSKIAQGHDSSHPRQAQVLCTIRDGHHNDLESAYMDEIMKILGEFTYELVERSHPDENYHANGPPAHIPQPQHQVSMSDVGV
eukprot:TRINITY_DN4868_c0_g4_i1.p1 TRINITY_DN4868_c0_g4~~TRINITY_DN4868_c0_g4_i1.p1  ORF type:complete len:341 (-),score=43.78 TRINITY_DN4868_c0_g4_i1:34-1032(-)